MKGGVGLSSKLDAALACADSITIRSDADTASRAKKEVDRLLEENKKLYQQWRGVSDRNSSEARRLLEQQKENTRKMTDLILANPSIAYHSNTDR